MSCRSATPSRWMMSGSDMKRLRVRMSLWSEHSICTRHMSLSATFRPIYYLSNTGVCHSLHGACGWNRLSFLHVRACTCAVYVWVCISSLVNYSQVKSDMSNPSLLIFLPPLRVQEHESVCLRVLLLYACACGGAAAGVGGGRVHSGQQAVKFNLSVNFTSYNSREEYSHCITDVLGSPPFFL